MRTNKKLIGFLTNLAQKHNGVLLPQTVVDAARPKTSPIHNQFEWNDSEAAEKYRIWQARHLLSVTVELMGEERKPLRVFCSLTPDRKRGGYRVTTEVLSDAQRRQQLLADALAELESFEAKYKQLQEFVELYSVVRRIRRRVEGRKSMRMAA